MSSIDPPKLHAAHAAAALVEKGMAVGLGSGTTAAEMIRRLGQRVQQEGLEFVGVATSAATAALAWSLHIRLRELDELGTLDLNLDGADEVDRSFRLIKGRGGALLREKIVVSNAQRRVNIVTHDKCVDRLGQTTPLPLEAAQFGLRHTEARIARLGAETTVRRKPDGSLFLTDGGNAIIDCRFGSIEDPDALDLRLRRIAGVLETGLFLGLCDMVVVGHDDRVEVLENTHLA